MNPGELDKRVTISSPPSATASQNDYGEPDGSWTELAERWAAIETIGGDEAFEGLQVIAKATHKVKIRYLSTITPGCKVEYGSQTFYVGLVDNRRMNHWEMVLICGEKVAA